MATRPAGKLALFPPSTCTIFCDETAQAGPNWLDERPFYITAAWIVRDEHLEMFRQTANELRNKINLQSNPSELKGRSFRNNKKRQTLALDWIKTIRNNRLAYPVYYIVERRFGACGKIVDLLLDPHHNHSAKWLDFDNIECKEEISEAIYLECPQSALITFCEALFRPSDSSWARALAQLADARWSNHQLRDSLIAANQMAKGLYEVEFTSLSRKGKDPALPHSPNYFSFRHLLQSCDIAVEETWPGCSAVAIHDEQTQYKDYFIEVYEWASGIGKTERQLGVLLPRQIGGLHSISEFKFVKSHEEVGIQSADLLAWTIYQIIGATCGDPATSSIALEDEYFDEIIGPFLMSERNARMHAAWKMKELMWHRALSIRRG